MFLRFIFALTFAFAAFATGRPGGKIVVADRGSGSITLIDTATDATATVAMPAGTNRPEPMYVVFSRHGNHVFVGDRANNRVVVFAAADFSVVREIPAGAGVFHMWASPLCRQLWVVNDVDKTVTVIDTVSLTVVAAIPMPADLVAAGGRPHDVILDPVAPYAYVSMLGLPAGSPDYVIKYSTRTFAEVARERVGKDPHLSLTWKNFRLYVPCQGSGQVMVLDRRTMTMMHSIAVPGAHGAGMAPSGRRFYTTDFTTGGAGGLYAIDTAVNAVRGVADVPVSTPHNIALTSDERKLYVTHSGANNQVSVFRIGAMDPTPRLLGTVTTGQNPFGLAYVPPRGGNRGRGMASDSDAPTDAMVESASEDAHEGPAPADNR